MRLNELFNFITERHNIYQRRQAGKPKPWTNDLILQQYRFCNVYRELDTVTQWIAKNWRWPHRNDPQLWFAMTVARLVNWPDTLARLAYPDAWSPTLFCETMRCIMKEGGKAWGGAYIVSTNGNAMPKEKYIARQVLDPLWTNRKSITLIYQQRSTTLAGFHEELSKFIGLGSFLAAQIIADLKYVAPLSKANDWETWAASGPGSRRGLNRVYEYVVDKPMPEATWLDHLQNLHKHVNPLIKAKKMPTLHAQDLQNCLCEFDKYERTRLGEGRPRSRYAGAS